MPTTLEAPPSPPESTPAYRGGGGGRGKPPWHLWIAVLIDLSFAIYLSWLAIRAFMWQPVATVVSVAWGVIATAIAFRRFHFSHESRIGQVALLCIVGGFVAEAMQIVVWRRFSIGIIWIGLGVLGIGGGFGVGSFSLVTLWYGAVSLCRLLVRWRAA
jgi:hypothetical protein